MPLPNDPVRWPMSMDPSDVVDFIMSLTGTPALLDVDNSEEIDSFTLTMSAEGVALGLTIGTDARAPELIEGNTAVKLWLSVDSGSQAEGAYSAAGVELGVVGRFTTNSSPSRTYERTWAVKVMQR